MSQYPVKLEYIGVFLDSQIEGKLLCLIDSLDIYASEYITITDQKVKKDIQPKLGNFEDDGFQASQAWGGKQELHSYISHCKDAYFYFIISVQESAQQQINKGKVQSMYQEIKKEITGYARGDIGTLKSNPKIKEKSLQSSLQPQLQAIFTSYQRNLGQKIDKVVIAQQKVDEVSSIMKQNISQMSKNVEDVESRLLPASQEINVFAKKTQSIAEEMEKETKSKNNCLKYSIIAGVFAVVGAGVAAAVILLK
ncbi:hypothetical protein FGO68_gene6530 [Halteria grandinella]|uniref:V-SNARE coiled-coil homology domain-containing protein n=1 Tax=Halteria grandinella TaxID=5974 RepID=A0A8J8NPF7_HALGN|nr:hypothetical protein FGO68_gene6530 [Halteria grandinella]